MAIQMSLESVFPNAKQFDTMNALLAAIAKNAGGLKIETYADIQRIVRMGLADSLFSVGDQIRVNKATSITAAVSGSGVTAASVDFQAFLNALGTVPAGVYQFIRASGAWTYNGQPVALPKYGVSVTGAPAEGDAVNVTVTGSKLVFDVVATDGYDTPSDSKLSHAMSLLLHDVATYGSLPFSPRQAFCYCADGLEAGTYHFTVATQPWYSGDVGKAMQFTLEVNVPAGGQLVLSNSYDKTMIGSAIKVYASPTATETLTTATISEGNGGTDLGNLTAAESGNLNSVHRAMLGSNRYAHSAMRQWINSAAASGWWKPQSIWDRPVSSPTSGFLYGVDPDFLAVLGKVKKRTALNTVTDGGGYEDTDELAWLASMTELNYGKNNNVSETSFGDSGEIIATPYPLFEGAKDADRVKYQGSTARYWFFRSPYPSYAYHVRYAYTSGALYYYNANLAYGAVPGLNIV